MEEWVFGTTIGDLIGLSYGSISPSPTKNPGVIHPLNLEVYQDPELELSGVTV